MQGLSDRNEDGMMKVICCPGMTYVIGRVVWELGICFQGSRGFPEVFQQLPDSLNSTSTSSLTTSMFTLHDNTYESSTGWGSISRNDSFACIPNSPGVASDYPSTSSMVAWAEKPHDRCLTTDLAYCDASQDDRLWMLSCAGVRAGEE